MPEKIKIENGLSQQEASRALKKHGLNELETAKPVGILSLLIDVFKEPMLLLLLSCCFIYLLLGDAAEAGLLLVSVLGVAMITFYQERKTEKSLDALRQLSSPQAVVIRDGQRKQIDSRYVVLEDIIVVSEGDRIPADAIILENSNLSVDESILTGESVPVTKSIYDGKPSEKKPGGDGQHYLYSGTLVTKGHGIARVAATGINTEIGKIGKALNSLEIEKTLLQKEVRKIITILASVGIGLCVLLVIIFGLTRHDWIHALLAGLTLAMGTLPEEFPIILTIFLSVGAWRLAQNKVLARRSATIETLGSTTVLCADKTGTLTKNKMSIASVYTLDGHITYHPKLSEHKIKEIVQYGLLASQKEPFDPMELAFIQAARDLFDHEKNIHEDMELVKEYALERYSLAVAHIWHNAKDKFKIAAKGAPEAILDLCHFNKTETEILMREVQVLAQEGYRVLGVAKGTIDDPESPPSNKHDIDYEFLGFVGLADPIRPEAASVIAECREADIRVVMITGDYPVTAQNIANQIGLHSPGGIVTGDELTDLSKDALCRRVKDVNIFARVVPEQKLLIVNAFKQNGEIVAMTGDGVNDAPALKSAHIGIAMGKHGTDVAREAASIVLLDDNFASIVNGIRTGRRIYDNLRKAMAYVFAVNLPLFGLSLAPVFFGWPLILLPAHIVFLELVVDPACTIAFEAQKEEPTIMKRPPRKMNEPIFNLRVLTISILQGISAFAASLVVFRLSLYFNFSTDHARALTFLVLVSTSIYLIIINLSWTQAFLARLRRNLSYALFAVSAFTVFLTIIVLTVPSLIDLFKFEPVGWLEAFAAITLGGASLSWFEILKYTRIKFSR